MIQVKELKDSGLLEYLEKLGNLRKELLDVDMSMSTMTSKKLEQERADIISKIRGYAFIISSYPYVNNY